MKYLLLNHKMNLLKDDILCYNYKLKEFNTQDCKLVVFPSNIYLSLFDGNNYEIGGQDVSCFIGGSYTSCVSANQLKSVGCSYCLVGHSERRRIFKETNSDICLKISNLQDVGIIPVLCIGEIDKENRYVLLEEQLSVISNCDLNCLIIAYEPVYSIGTGVVLDNSEIDTVICWIKNYIFNKYKKDIPVLYGGSVNEDNISILNNISSLDGFLVGGASLDAIKVGSMLEVLNNGKIME